MLGDWGKQMSDEINKGADRIESASDKRILDDTYFMMTPRLFAARVEHYVERSKKEGADIEGPKDPLEIDGMLNVRQIKALIALAESASVTDIFEAQPDMSKTRKQQNIKAVKSAVFSLKRLLEKR